MEIAYRFAPNIQLAFFINLTQKESPPNSVLINWINWVIISSVRLSVKRQRVSKRRLSDDAFDDEINHPITKVVFLTIKVQMLT